MFNSVLLPCAPNHTIRTIDGTNHLITLLTARSLNTQLNSLYASFGMLLTSTQLHNLFVHMCVCDGARSLRTVPCQGCVGGHHHNHQHMLRNQYQTQTQAGSSSSSVVGDWSMGSPVHTPLSSSSSSSSSAAAALVSRLEPGPSSSRRHHRMANSMTRSPPLPAPPLTSVSSGSRQKVYRRQGPGHDDNGDGDEDEGDEYDYEDQEGLGDDDMVLG